MKTRTLTHAQRQARRKAIADDVNGGLSVADAAAKHGVGLNCAYQACKEFGVAVMTKNPDTALICRVLFDLLHSNETMQQLASKYSLAPSRVHRVLTHARRAGFRFSSVGRQDRKGIEDG